MNPASTIAGSRILRGSNASSTSPVGSFLTFHHRFSPTGSAITGVFFLAVTGRSGLQEPTPGALPHAARRDDRTWGTIVEQPWSALDLDESHAERPRHQLADLDLVLPGVDGPAAEFANHQQREREQDSRRPARRRDRSRG